MAASITRLRRAAWFLGRVDVSGTTAVEHVIVSSRHGRSGLGRRGAAAGGVAGPAGADTRSWGPGGVVRAVGGAVAGLSRRRRPLVGADPARRGPAPGWRADRPARRPRRRG